MGLRDGIQVGSIVCAKHQLRLASPDSCVIVEAGSKGRVLSAGGTRRSAKVEFDPPLLKEVAGGGTIVVEEAILLENLPVYSLLLAL